MYPHLLSSKIVLLRSPAEQARRVPWGGDGSSAAGSVVPRAGTTSKTTPFSLFDRVVQLIADRLKIGSAYKMYCLSSNLKLLCRKPEEWKKDPAKSEVLECLLKDCKSAPDFQSVLEKTLAPLSESSLSQRYALAKEMQEKSFLKNFHGGSELLTAFANHGLEMAAKRIVSFYEASNGNKFDLHLGGHMLLTFMAECPDIDEATIENALIRQFEAVLSSVSKWAGSKKSADKCPPRTSAWYLGETFQTKNTSSEVFAENIDLGLCDGGKADLQCAVKHKDVDEAKSLLANARVVAESRIKSNENLHRAGMGTEKTSPLKSDQEFLSKHVLAKKLERCFNDYYKSIDAERFESAGAEKAIRKLYGALAALEKNSLKPSYMRYFLRKIEWHVKKNAVGREGNLLEKLQSGESGFKGENGETKRFSKFYSISTVVDFSKSSMNESKTLRKTKNQPDLGLNSGNEAGVASNEYVKVIL
jgi:hypothetical protein